MSEDIKAEDVIRMQKQNDKAEELVGSEPQAEMHREMTEEKIEAERLRQLGRRYLLEAERLEHPEKFELKRRRGHPNKGTTLPPEDKPEQQKWDFDGGEVAIVDGGSPETRKPGPDPLRFGCDNVEPGDNSRYLRFAMASRYLPKIDTSDPKQVEQRIYDYFGYCYDHDRKPNIVGMANWLGVSRGTLAKWRSGDYTKSTIGDIINCAISQMEEQWVDYMMNGRVNPASGIFIGKNHYQYRDTQNYVVTPTSPLQDLNDDSAQLRMIEALPDEDG